jgi:hypothetical protein
MLPIFPSVITRKDVFSSPLLFLNTKDFNTFMIFSPTPEIPRGAGYFLKNVLLRNNILQKCSFYKRGNFLNKGIPKNLF